jgi:hypothetical protein
MPEEWIFQFDRAHEPGTICGFPCAQCGDREMVISVHGKRVPDTPMLIIAPATEAEWRANITSNGRDGSKARVFAGAHYYRVSMD